MLFISRIILIFVTTLHVVSAYDNADVRFEVERIGPKRLTIKAFEQANQLFSQTVDPNFNAALLFGQHVLSREGASYKIVYKGQDDTSLTLTVDDEGNITLADNREKTGFERHKSWGFKTPGIIHHTGASLFYQMFTHANQFHNYGVLKSYTGTFLQNYLFNRGIIHFGDETAHVSPEAYREYLAIVNQAAQPAYERGLIDDHGVILAENGLHITNLIHRSQGLVDIGGQGLRLENAGIDNRKTMTVEGPITGTLHHFWNQGYFFADSMNPSTLTIQNWENRGDVYLRRDSDLFSQDSWNNTGGIFVNGNISVGSRKRPQALGTVIAEGVIKALIEEAMDEAAAKTLFGGAAFISGKRKAIFNFIKHTDHYLNTITDYYLVDQYGRRTFSHQTQTGYIFQKRTTERTIKEVEVGDPSAPALIQEMLQALQGKRDFLKALRQGIKERLKKLGLLHANHDAILSALLKGLREAGLGNEDIEEILGDEGINDLLSLASVYDQLSSERRQGLEADLPDVGSYLKSIHTQAQRLGQPLWQWARQHGPELVEGLCNLAILTSRFIQHPLVTVPAGVCTVRRLGPGVIQKIESVRAFYNKQHGGERQHKEA